MNEITLHSPLDMHVHFRQGDLLRDVVPHSAVTFAGALVMPNTDPPVFTRGHANCYRDEVFRAAGPGFWPYMTLYFQPDLGERHLINHFPDILAVKFYPRNLTTNAHHGCDPADPRVDDVLAVLERSGVPLCVHAEAEGYHEDREYLFHTHVARWATSFPGLKIVLEHVSDRRTLDLVRAYRNVHATVTPHHLLITGDDWVGPPLRPHLYCMPVAKRPEDRDALRDAVLYWPDIFFRKLMLGTDSAPHPDGNKVSACGCAGIFTAPVALQLLAPLFAAGSTVERFQAFAGDNARALHGIVPPEKAVTLVRRPFVIPARYGPVVPMWAGRTLDWSVAP